MAMAAPRTWILASPHAGDNTQLFALADALGWPYETKRLIYRPSERLLRFLGQATLAALSKESLDKIMAPFPDLIIAAGRASEAIASWIRKFGNGDARLVFIGTPWGDLARFDLVIATPQYALARRANVLMSSLPLHRVHAEALAAAAQSWRPRLQHLPRPLTAVLVGGSSGPYVFDQASAERLGRDVSRLAHERGGALLVSTSARTGLKASQALAAAISVPSYHYDWASGGSDNPYLAFLALAERIVVTADSISMISEASATGKPVLLFDIETGRQSMRAEASEAGILPAPHWRGRTPGATAFRLAMRFGPPRWSRDLRIVHRNVVSAGRANWLGDASVAKPPALPPTDLRHAVARVQALFKP
jgi:uncharacterized protein